MKTARLIDNYCEFVEELKRLSTMSSVKLLRLLPDRINEKEKELKRWKSRKQN